MSFLRNLIHYLRQLARSDPGQRLADVPRPTSLDLIQFTRITDLR